MELKYVVESFVRSFLTCFTVPPVNLQTISDKRRIPPDCLDYVKREQRLVALFLKPKYRMSVEWAHKNATNLLIELSEGKIDSDEAVGRILAFNATSLQDDISELVDFYIEEVRSEDALSSDDYNIMCDMVSKIVRDEYLEPGFADKAVYFLDDPERMPDIDASTLFVAASTEVEVEELKEYIGITDDELEGRATSKPRIDI